MTAQAAPAPLESAVETVLQEYERQCARASELEAELDAARRRRANLAASLDALLGALEPQAARAYAPRLAALAPERRPGRPAPDGRHAAFLTPLADWPEPTITTAEATRRLRALGHEIPTRYAANSLGALARRGALAPIGKGAYRIVRTGPDMLKPRVPPRTQA